MSFVGPRPPILYELEFYTQKERGRFLAKPGITGLWQVSGRSSTTFAKMVELDLRYIYDWSIFWILKYYCGLFWPFSGYMKHIDPKN